MKRKNETKIYMYTCHVYLLGPQNISKAWKTEVNGDIKKQNVKWLNIAHPA